MSIFASKFKFSMKGSSTSFVQEMMLLFSCNWSYFHHVIQSLTVKSFKHLPKRWLCQSPHLQQELHGPDHEKTRQRRQNLERFRRELLQRRRWERGRGAVWRAFCLKFGGFWGEEVSGCGGWVEEVVVSFPICFE